MKPLVITNGFSKNEMKFFGNECQTRSRRRRRPPPRRAVFTRVLQVGCLSYYLSIETVFANSFLRRTAEKESSLYPNEPFYGNQSWIFEAIDMVGAWNMGFTGKNVRVRINDNSWESNHTEWMGEGRVTENNKNAEDGYSCGDPNNTLTKGKDRGREALNHGAAVTSILAADGTNGFCGTGIAPKSELSFCNFVEGRTAASVLSHGMLPQNTTIDVSMSRETYDVSVNAFAHEGCGAETRGIGLHKPEPRDSTPSRRRLLRPHETSIELCPFENFYNDIHNKGDDPCRVCTKADFDFVKGINSRDNVFSATKFSSNNKNKDKIDNHGLQGYDPTGVSKECAANVRSYCLRNFRSDEALCSEWIEMINHGNTCQFKSNVGKDTHRSLEIGAKEGRNGKGVVYIFAAGDSYGNGDNVNYQAYPKSRFVITVGAVKVMEISSADEGTVLKPVHATYSTGGSSVFLVAPGGDYDSPYKHVGAGGNENSCVDIDYGTAYAAPIVGGVVALMLEAYPKATWRDIRAILVETSNPVEFLDREGNNDDDTFATNAAGIGYSDLYGFGMIDARAAVKKAKTWKRKERYVPSELSITARSGNVNLDIYDDSFSATTSTIMLYDEQYNTDSATLESVSVYVKLRYFNR